MDEEKRKVSQAKYRQNNRQKQRDYLKVRRLSVKMDVLNHYGNKCSE